jgi:hypothetical protein
MYAYISTNLQDNLINLTMKTLASIFLCAAVIQLSACAFGPPNNSGFGNIQGIADLEGMYRNLGEGGISSEKTYLSQVIWPDHHNHALITSVEVRVSGENALRVTALRDNLRIRESTFVEGEDFSLHSGRIHLKTDFDVANDNIIGAGVSIIDLGIDKQGHGKYRTSGAAAGIALVIPFVAVITEDVRFPKIGK